MILYFHQNPSTMKTILALSLAVCAIFCARTASSQEISTEKIFAVEWCCFADDGRVLNFDYSATPYLIIDDTKEPAPKRHIYYRATCDTWSCFRDDHAMDYSLRQIIVEGKDSKKKTERKVISKTKIG